jgi:hypothetical protein
VQPACLRKVAVVAHLASGRLGKDVDDVALSAPEQLNGRTPRIVVGMVEGTPQHLQHVRACGSGQVGQGSGPPMWLSEVVTAAVTAAGRG